MAKTKEQFVIIDNSDNYFNLNEVVERVGIIRNIEGKRKRMYKSLERDFKAYITDNHVKPRSDS